MKLVFNTLYFILLGIDALMIAVLTWNMIQPTFRPGESRLIFLFLMLIGTSYYIRKSYPKVALIMAAFPVLTPLLIWGFLILFFVLFSLVS